MPIISTSTLFLPITHVPENLSLVTYSIRKCSFKFFNRFKSTFFALSTKSCQSETMRFLLNEFCVSNEGDEFGIADGCCCFIDDTCGVVIDDDAICLAENGFWNFAVWVLEFMIAENSMEMKKKREWRINFDFLYIHWYTYVCMHGFSQIG